MRLTDKTIAGLTIPHGKSELLVFDDDLPGFGLRLRAGGSRKWIFQYRHNGRQHRMTLDSGLNGRCEGAGMGQEASSRSRPRRRSAAGEGRRSHSGWANVREDCRRLSCISRREWRPASMRAGRRYLLAYAKSLHGMELAKIDRAMIAAQLNRIERESGAVTANRFRATVSSFFNWAAREGLIDTNPAAFTNRRAETPRDRVLSR